MPNLRFEFRVLNEDGEVIVSDWTTFDAHDVRVNGECEMIDMHTGSAMRFVRREYINGKLKIADTEAA